MVSLVVASTPQCRGSDFSLTLIRKSRRWLFGLAHRTTIFFGMGQVGNLGESPDT